MEGNNIIFLVKGDSSDIEHNKLLGKISVEKTYLRREANGKISDNNGYLIKNDKIKLLDYVLLGEQFWLKVSYSNPSHGKIQGWILEDDIDIY